MPTIAPWLQLNPAQDFLEASKSGASLGLQRSKIATDAQEASGRLGLGYAQLAAEQAANSQRAALARSQAAEDLMLKKWGMDDLQTFRNEQLADKDRQIAVQENLAAAELMKRASADKLTEGLSSIFQTAGKSREEINAIVAANPSAAAQLTGPQWEYILGPKQDEPRVNIPLPSGNPINDIQGINQPRISGKLEQVLSLLGTNAPPALRSIPLNKPSTNEVKTVGKYKVTPIN